ncbi:MAG: protein-disulfide reductase DsbD domain-containing protein [Bacteroidota bacterium]
MNKITLLFLAVLSGSLAMAQSSKEVTWTTSAKKINDKTYEVHMTAAVGGDYHIYSQHPGGDGPIPTSFKFKKNPLVTPVGAVKEVGKMVKKMETAWGFEVVYYEKTVDFVVNVSVKGNAKTSLAGTVEYMVCNDHQCLPPADTDLNIKIGG